jgi:hypothetical protein
MPVGLSGEQLLDVWERGRGQDGLTRGLLLWAAAEPDRPLEELARAPIGAREAALLQARRATFGPVADCYLRCPACTQELEFAFDLAALGAVGQPQAQAQAQAQAQFGAVGRLHTLDVAGWSVEFRLPGTEDLRAVASAPDDDARLAALLRAVVVSAEHPDVEPDVTDPGVDLPADVVAALDAALGRLDPAGELRLDLDCAACGTSWAAAFEVGSYLWREVEVAARRLLAEVDALAGAYGWSEREILALTPARRRSYLELVGR